MHAPERTDRRVDARELHGDEAELLLAAAGAAVALKAEPADAELLERGQQLEWKRIVGPILVDDRLDVGFQIGPNLFHQRHFVGGQNLRELIEVAVRDGHRLRGIGLAGCGCCGHVESP